MTALTYAGIGARATSTRTATMSVTSTPSTIRCTGAAECSSSISMKTLAVLAASMSAAAFAR